MFSLPLIFTLLALLAYASGFSYLLKQFLAQQKTNPFLVWSCLLCGLILHALVLAIDMHGVYGIDYDVFNLISFTCALMLLLSIVFSMYRPVLFLNLVSTPIAMLGLITGLLFSTPGHAIHERGFGMDMHIFFSLTAYTILFMATIHAVLFWVQNNELKKKSKKRLWVNMLPSLQTMESLLFDLLWIGFILLTIASAFGLFAVDNFFGQHLAHKTVFSIISWLIYGYLLFGRLVLGWRGMKAVKFTLTAFILLAVGFLGSKFVLEILLHRS